MNDAQIKKRLRDRNPWWLGERTWESSDPDLSEAASAPFSYKPSPLEDIGPPGLYLLMGPRRVGKSVELKRAIAATLATNGRRPTEVIFCTCDGMSAQDLRRLILMGHDLTSATAERWWFLDEITSVRGWFDTIKELRDQDPVFRSSCVVLTGSSARDLRRAKKSLAGRRGHAHPSDRLLLPMSFRDFLPATGVEIAPGIDPLFPDDVTSKAWVEAVAELAFWVDRLGAAWDNYVTVGGFPRAVSDFIRHADVRQDFVDGIFDVIKDDAIHAEDMSGAVVLSLLGRITESLCTPLNATAVANDVGLSDHHAVGRRIDDLVESFYVWRCYRKAKGRPHVGAQQKVYFTDPVVARIAARRNPDYSEPDATQLTQQQLGVLLARAVEKRRPGAFLDGTSLMYERKRSGEIDFVGYELSAPIESKYTDSGWKQGTRAIESRYGRGVMATRSVIELEADVKAFPAAILGWLLG